MGSYRVSRLALLALALAALGGCARDVTSPGATTAPRFSAVAGTSSYLVLFKANAVPADFAGQVKSLGGTVTYSHAGAGIAVVRGLTSAASAKLAARKDVQNVTADVPLALDRPVRAQASLQDLEPVPDPTTALAYGWQWNMRLIHANDAWAAGKVGSSDVTVAILDTGIDYDAFDLQGLVDFARDTSFMFDENEKLHAFDPSRLFIDDLNGHGTNVATQVSSNALLFAGVTARTKLMAVKVLGADGASTGASVYAGLLYAADHGADIANLSLGTFFARAGYGRLFGYVNRVFDYANRKGMLIVVSAGNAGANLDQSGSVYAAYCNAPHVICVSSVGPVVASQLGTLAANTPAYYTNFGRSAISVAAPGGNGGVAYSVWPWSQAPLQSILNAYSWVWSSCAKNMLVTDAHGVPVEPWSLAGCQSGWAANAYVGTSQAAPHVSGLAALLVAQMGHRKPSQIKAAIMKSADDLGQPGVDPYFGAGRINVAKALGL